MLLWCIVLLEIFISACRSHAYTMPEMGVISECDWAKPANDWNVNDASTYTCNGRMWPIPMNGGVKVYAAPNFDPNSDYDLQHVCTNETLTYPERPPLRGPHRPNWGRYGEYVYIPAQRWLHNLVHGAVVMLYEPCTDPKMVDAVRKIVKDCIYLHVITPYKGLGQDYPVNLLTWGAKIQIGQVDRKAIVTFIKQHALRGPEPMSTDGFYDTSLIQASQIVKGSDVNDTVLCPRM